MSCVLMFVTINLIMFSLSYGIATPKGSKWRDPISLAILELQEKGTIQMLYNKWWKNTGDVCTRQVQAPANTPFVFLMSPSRDWVMSATQSCWGS